MKGGQSMINSYVSLVITLDDNHGQDRAGQTKASGASNFLYCTGTPEILFDDVDIIE